MRPSLPTGETARSGYSFPACPTTPNEALDLVLRFCDAFGKGATPTELVDYFTDDAVYHNIPVEPAVGHEAILGLLNMFLTPTERVEFRVRNIVADGDTVLTERVDVFQLPNARYRIAGHGYVRGAATARSRPGATTSISTSTCRSCRERANEQPGGSRMNMEYRRLGPSGLQVSVLSFGSWVSFGDQLGIAEAADCLQAAYDAGVNFFDNAEAYAGGESERIMGAAIAKLGWQRALLRRSPPSSSGASTTAPT